MTVTPIDTRFMSTGEQYDYAVNAMRAEIKAYITEYRLKSLVLGISGGIDSAFAAALLRPVCDITDTKLIGRSITIETNKADEIERANAIGNAFCHDYQYLDHTDIYLQYKKLMPALDTQTLSKLRMGNAKARFRMICLYDLAQMNKGIVISTDNFTEYLTGFWTLHGDVGDYAPFIRMWKTEVYRCSEWLCKSLPSLQSGALMQCIKATPTDGLGISSSDLEQLGAENYHQVDILLARYLEGDNSQNEHPVIKRYLSSEYKRQNPLSISRKTLYLDI
ncbi:MAG: NAD(+) synthase [Bacteroidales bacterium]|nr:NAD(+) synthase [Bacteroidales bacterium]